MLEALIESYNHVVVHASDWRSSSARDEIPSFSAILLCARRARLAALRESVAREVGNPAIAIEGLALEKLRPPSGRPDAAKTDSRRLIEARLRAPQKCRWWIVSMPASCPRTVARFSATI